MRIGFHGQLSDEPEIRAGFIGCGSHSFRNIYPTFQFAPVNLVAVCDVKAGKAEAFARKFGAERWYLDHREMLAKEKLDAVFIVTGYDKLGRPLYPELLIDCVNAGCHAWIEKPPAATCGEIERMQAAAQKAGKNAMVGLKKMFFPANEKVKELMGLEEFGKATLISIQYPQAIPTTEDFHKYLSGRQYVPNVVYFLDHLCHPAALLVYLAGMPQTLYYERATNGGGVATFTFANGLVAMLLLTAGAGLSGGMERTIVVGDRGRHIIADNNIRVSYHRHPRWAAMAGNQVFSRMPGETTSFWEPEFSLGQLYNKGLFLLGYYGEVAEFAASILEKRAPVKATLEDAWKVTRIFEAFVEGPGKVIQIAKAGSQGLG